MPTATPTSVAPAAVAPTTVAPATVPRQHRRGSAGRCRCYRDRRWHHCGARSRDDRRARRDVAVDDHHLAAQPAQYDGGDAAAARLAAYLHPNTGAPTAVFPVVVLSALSRPGYGTEFTTDHGGVWIQTETKPLILPKTPFNAELQPGKFGGTFLVLPDRKLAVRVRTPGK